MTTATHSLTLQTYFRCRRPSPAAAAPPAAAAGAPTPVVEPEAALEEEELGARGICGAGELGSAGSLKASTT